MVEYFSATLFSRTWSASDFERNIYSINTKGIDFGSWRKGSSRSQVTELLSQQCGNDILTWGYGDTPNRPLSQRRDPTPSELNTVSWHTLVFSVPANGGVCRFAATWPCGHILVPTVGILSTVTVGGDGVHHLVMSPGLTCSDHERLRHWPPTILGSSSSFVHRWRACFPLTSVRQL